MIPMPHMSPFPHFAKLTLAHKNQVTAITKQFDSYSDFNFTSLFAWSDNAAEISLLHDNLVIKLPDYIDGHPVYALLGKHKIDESIEALLGVTDKLELIPEVVIKNITNKAPYEITEDRDSFDYVYKLDELGRLAGAKYKRIRNKANSFAKAHEQAALDISVLHKLDSAHVKLLKNLNERWALGTEREFGDTAAETKAINTLLDNADAFDLLTTVISVDGDIKAFSINEILDKKHAICHFEKALRSYHHTIYTFLACQVAEQLLLAGCQWVNWEQDVGIEGLRKAKMAYRPAHMLKKYTVKRRS